MSSVVRSLGGPADRRATARRSAGLLGSAITLDGAKSVIVEDLCSRGAKIVGRVLPGAGKEILLRTTYKMVLGRIAWAKDDFRGVMFEEGAMEPTA